jgi:hypothetical protein
MNRDCCPVIWENDYVRWNSKALLSYGLWICELKSTELVYSRSKSMWDMRLQRCLCIFSLPEYQFDTVQFSEGQLPFLRFILFQSSGLKNKLSRKYKWRRQQAVQRYTAPPQTLSASVVLLLLFYKQTVITNVPLRGAYCSTDCQCSVAWCLL